MQHFCLGSHNRKLPPPVEGKFICSQEVGLHNNNVDKTSLIDSFRPPAILCLLFNIINVFPSVCLIGQDYLVSGQPNKPLLNVWQVHPMESTDIPHRANLQVNRSEQIPLRLFTPGPVSSLATSPTGSYLAAAVQESITIWQIGTGGPAVQFLQTYFPCLIIRGLAGCAVPALPACDCPLLHQRRKSSDQWRGGWTGFDQVISS